MPLFLFNFIAIVGGWDRNMGGQSVPWLSPSVLKSLRGPKKCRPSFFLVGIGCSPGSRNPFRLNMSSGTDDFTALSINSCNMQVLDLWSCTRNGFWLSYMQLSNIRFCISGSISGFVSVLSSKYGFVSLSEIYWSRISGYFRNTWINAPGLQRLSSISRP